MRNYLIMCNQKSPATGELRNIVKIQKCLHNIARIVLTFEYWGWLALEPEQLIGRGR